MIRTPFDWILRTAARLAPLVVVAAVVVVPARSAQAQWGIGYGGFWGYNPENSSQVVNAINQRSLIAGQNAMANRQNIQPAADGRNSYMNHLRDTQYVERYDISTRRTGSSNVARRFNPEAAPAPAREPAPPSKPVIALSSFFNAANKLIWPADAPTNSGLGAKRDESDQASLKVLQESRTQGIASVASVTEARNLLLDYGRPALQYLRDGSTPQVADSFHRFLLGLYEALAQAGQPPPAPAAPRR